MKEMIRRFDEVISEKASKVALDQYAKDARTLFVTVSDYKNEQTAMNDSQTQLEKIIANLETRLGSQNDEIQQKISSRLDKVVSEHFSQYEKVSQQFQRFFNADELEKVINSKADIRRVDRQLSNKATHSDIQNCLGVV